MTEKIADLIEVLVIPSTLCTGTAVYRRLTLHASGNCAKYESRPFRSQLRVGVLGIRGSEPVIEVPVFSGRLGLSVSRLWFEKDANARKIHYGKPRDIRDQVVAGGKS